MKHIVVAIYRSLLRKPVTNLINLGGLAVSLALVIMLSVYSYSELTTDHFQKNRDRLYVFCDIGEGHSSLHTPAILKEQIDLNLPESEIAVRVAGTWEEPVFQADNRDPITSDLITADPGFFKLFTYEAVEGNLTSALKDPMTIVLSEQLAQKLFGKEPAMGKSVKINDKQTLTVTGVFKQPNSNSALHFSSVTSNETRKIVYPNGGEFTEWGWWNFNLYLLMKEGTDLEAASRKIASFFPKEEKNNYRLHSFGELYFNGIAGSGEVYLHGGDKQKVMILLMVAALVLIIALINFINISASQWLGKIRQTGVLKVIGASQGTIWRGVFGETFFLFLISLIAAILIVVLVYPLIGNFTGIHFDPSILYQPTFIFCSILGISLLSLLFSLIPARRIAASSAVDNLRRNVAPKANRSVWIGVMVTGQFAIAIVLIAFTLLVQKQVNFGSGNFSFAKENTLSIRLTPQLNREKEVLRTFIQSHPMANKISFSQFYPGRLNEHWSSNQQIDGQKIQLDFDTFSGDADLCSILELKPVQGRLFSSDLMTDLHKLLVNETFVKVNKLDHPLGMKFVMGFGEHAPLCEIIGVVKDFHYKPVTTPIGALIIQNEPYPAYCLVNLQSSDFSAINGFVQELKKETGKLSPAFPVEIGFLDQAVEQLYQSEVQFRRTFSLFAGCAIVICCLGILAMSLFACQRRIKEIGVRKVNGAKVGEVMAMLNRDFVRWVAMALVISIPLAWQIMHQWLEGYVYKTEISWWIFAASGCIALAIALFTVSWQSWRAATRNPVEALRYE
ncbi:MAG: ABC transporter permease [Marinilabiliales bacterium]|nr:ABC transporter permease [Marinilabiliales bacterium]